MIIERPRCEAKVLARVVGELQYPPDDVVDPHKYLFMECPGCKEPLLGYSEFVSFDAEHDGWYNPTRLWPAPDPGYSSDIPRAVRSSLQEARRCFAGGAFAACAVMCGRALEAMSKEKTGETTLAAGLKKLRASNIIDGRLFDWGEALRRERNIGAHASEAIVSRRDAEDLLDFATAIFDYVYVMSAKFEAYQQRKAKS